MYLFSLELILISLDKFFFTEYSSCLQFFQFLSCLLGLKLSNGTFPEQVYKRRDISAQIVQRAEKSGYKAIILTVDAPRLGRREADIKNRFMSSHFACVLFLHAMEFIGFEV